jgi:hypothetical protein
MIYPRLKLEFAALTAARRRAPRHEHPQQAGGLASAMKIVSERRRPSSAGCQPPSCGGAQ